MTSALFWDFTQRRMVIPYRRFGTTYRSHPQGSRRPTRLTWTSWPSKMGPTGCRETSLRN